MSKEKLLTDFIKSVKDNGVSKSDISLIEDSIGEKFITSIHNINSITTERSTFGSDEVMRITHNYIVDIKSDEKVFSYSDILWLHNRMLSYLGNVKCALEDINKNYSEKTKNTMLTESLFFSMSDGKAFNIFYNNTTIESYIRYIITDIASKLDLQINQHVLKDNDKLTVIKDYFNNDYKNLNNDSKDVPYFMGLDLGVVNFATVSFYTANRDKNYVISGKTLKSRINNLDIKIDKKKKELCIDVIKTIQSKKDKKEVLTRQELNLLNEYYKSIYENKIISVSQERKSNISSDFIHKLSKCLIEECMSKEIKVIVVGKNKGWKNEINNGAKNNRAMYNFPHAKFIETLKYKALLKDIVVIEVEESYTSKTSFIDNEELRVFNNDEERNLTQGDKSQLSKGKKKLLGKRINQKFISKEKKVIHADVNGSFNIVRKVLLNFSYKEEIINLSYELMEISNYRKRKLFNFYKTKEINKVKNENLTLNEHCG